MDAAMKKLIRIDRLATGGKGDALNAKTHSKKIIDHCKTSEYVPELLPNGTRQDLKALNVSQPDGPSFSVDGSLIEWQNWRFRVGFNPREGATIHDVHYGGRSVMYRMGISEMVCEKSTVMTMRYTNRIFRPFLMRILEASSLESRPLTLVTVVLAIAPTTCLWAATVWV